MIPQDQVEELVAAARQASKRAYAPYSHHAVGAAVLAASGRVYTGCNVENAAYNLTVCAEQVAVGTAVASGERAIVAVAVASPKGATPCGACRQVLAEFLPAATEAGGDMVVIVADAQSHRTLHLPDLLPEAFTARHLV